VPAPGDYGDGEFGGMMIGRGKPSTPRKLSPVLLCPPQTPHVCPDANPGGRGGTARPILSIKNSQEFTNICDVTLPRTVIISEIVHLRIIFVMFK
jgi:hypothetical protein